MPIVESEFLLALRADDRKHKVALAIFDTYPVPEGCSAAFLEIAWLLRSKGKNPTQVSLTLAILRAEPENRDVTEAPVTSSQIERANDSLSRHSMTFFHALILANAEESQDKQLVSNDSTFDSIGTVERISLK